MNLLFLVMVVGAFCMLALGWYLALRGSNRGYKTIGYMAVFLAVLFFITCIQVAYDLSHYKPIGDMQIPL